MSREDVVVDPQRYEQPKWYQPNAYDKVRQKLQNKTRRVGNGVPRVRQGAVEEFTSAGYIPVLPCCSRHVLLLLQNWSWHAEMEKGVTWRNVLSHLVKRVPCVSKRFKRQNVVHKEKNTGSN